MKKYIAITVCLFVSLQLSAFSYQYSAPPTDFRSTSAYTGSYAPSSARAYSPSGSGSFSAISAENYRSLNSEGGACYQPAAAAAPRRVSRPDGSGGSGVVDTHSPVGSTPWLLFALLTGGYVVYKKNALCERFFQLV